MLFYTNEYDVENHNRLRDIESISKISYSGKARSKKVINFQKDDIPAYQKPLNDPLNEYTYGTGVNKRVKFDLKNELIKYKSKIGKLSPGYYFSIDKYENVNKSHNQYSRKLPDLMNRSPPARSISRSKNAVSPSPYLVERVTYTEK